MRKQRVLKRLIEEALIVWMPAVAVLCGCSAIPHEVVNPPMVPVEPMPRIEESHLAISCGWETIYFSRFKTRAARELIVRAAEKECEETAHQEGRNILCYFSITTQEGECYGACGRSTIFVPPNPDACTFGSPDWLLPVPMPNSSTAELSKPAVFSWELFTYSRNPVNSFYKTKRPHVERVDAGLARRVRRRLTRLRRLLRRNEVLG